jgi:hypothetical protein
MKNNQSVEELSVLFKLVNGDNIIGTVVAENELFVLVKEVFQLITTVNQGEGGGLTRNTYYTEWFPSSDSKVNIIERSHIISAALPGKEILDQYVKLLVKSNPKESTSSMKESGQVKANDKKKASSSWDDLKFKWDSKPGRMNN